MAYSTAWSGGLGGWCKHGQPIRVFGDNTKSPVEVWAGSWQQNCRPPEGSIVVDLANGFTPAIIPIGIDIPGVTWRRIVVQWPDGGVPRLRAGEWRNIVDALVSADQPVFVACTGGHGRTGSALAIIGHFLGAYPTRDTDPVAWLRKAYCEEAVETVAQTKYIATITGRTVAEKPSYSVGVTKGKDEVEPTDNPAECKWAPDHNGCAKMGHERVKRTPLRADMPVTKAAENSMCLYKKIPSTLDNHTHRCILPPGHITLSDKYHSCYCGEGYHDSVALEPIEGDTSTVPIRRTDGHAEWCKGTNCDPAWCRPGETPTADAPSLDCYKCGAPAFTACEPTCENVTGKPNTFKQTVAAMVEASKEALTADDDDELPACDECGAEQGQPCAVDCPEFLEALEVSGEVCAEEDDGAICRLPAGHVEDGQPWHKDGPISWRDRPGARAINLWEGE